MRLYYREFSKTITLLFIIDCLFSEFSVSQGKESFLFESFTANLDKARLSVFNNNEELIYEKEFFHPSCYTSDLDEDLSEELLVKDSIMKSGKYYFTLYIYNMLDTFRLADSIYSGALSPYEAGIIETGEKILVCGNPDFETFGSGNNNFLPVSCYKFSDAEIHQVNDEIYDIFISANEEIIDFMDEFYNSESKDCITTEKLKSAIAAVYVNYINAGENSVANQFLKNYYLCKDSNGFINKIKQLMIKD
jgi:hypothetical protein